LHFFPLYQEIQRMQAGGKKFFNEINHLGHILKQLIA